VTYKILFCKVTTLNTKKEQDAYLGEMASRALESRTQIADPDDRPTVITNWRAGI
jgi:hypothetical protein